MAWPALTLTRSKFQVECYLYTPFNKKYRYGCLYLSSNFVCFNSHVFNQVRLVIPLRDVALVEKTEANPNGYTVDQAISISLKSVKSPYIFAQLPDREFVVEKISDLLSKLEVRVDTAYFKLKKLKLLCGTFRSRSEPPKSRMVPKQLLNRKSRS